MKHSTRAAEVTLALIGLAVAGSPGIARADGGPFGAGIILGEPSGLSLKLFLDSRHALDGALDYSLRSGGLYVHADYLLHFTGYQTRGGTRHLFLPYVGIGARLGVHGDRGHDERASGALGLRVPLGLCWIPADLPIDIFLEVVPGLFILPDTDPDLAAGLGLRYFF